MTLHKSSSAVVGAVAFGAVGAYWGAAFGFAGCISLTAVCSVIGGLGGWMAGVD